MLQRYFGFNGDPFGDTPDPRCLYESGTHREALASLLYGFYSNRGFTVLIAPPGMGKTTLLFRFLTDIRMSARSVFLFDIDTQCQPQELVDYILRDIGVAPGRTSAEAHQQLDDVLLVEAHAGRRFVVVIDEAQNLSDAALEKIRLLTNFETPQGKLMQIVLAGQPQLSERLMRPSLAQLRQRISIVCRLEQLSPEEIKAYIDHRLKLAGYRGESLFADTALEMIADASHGIPRTINTLCFNALSLCCSLKSRRVDSSMVAEAVADLQLIPKPTLPVAEPSESPAKRPGEPEPCKQVARLARIWAAAIVVALLASILGAIALSQLLTARSSKAGYGHSLNLPVAPKPVQAPARATSDKIAPGGPTPKIKKSKIAVAPHQTAEDIALKFIGAFDQQRSRQIQALNPELVDPDNIEPGQQLLLPAPAIQTATPPANVRTLQ
jgi:general secretion pathway protein A